MPGMTLPQLQNTPDIFSHIRAGFAHVAAQARHVRIHHDRLEAYAKALPPRHPASVFDTDHHYIGGPEDTASYVLALDAINYGSGYKDELAAEGWPLIEGSIYYSVSVRLKNAYEKAPLSAQALAQMSAERVHDILELPHQPQSSALATLFAQGLRDLGDMIVRDHSGCFLSFVNDAHGRAARVVEKLGALPQFADVHDYHGRAIPLYKRAQIAAADLHLAFARLGIHLFHDMDRMTMFPDNGVPQVLEADGLVEYTPALKARILRHEEIPCGSDEEIEIRGCAGHVVAELARMAQKTDVETDHILWHRHAEDARYKAHPSHKTLCLFY